MVRSSAAADASLRRALSNLKDLRFHEIGCVYLGHVTSHITLYVRTLYLDMPHEEADHLGLAQREVVEVVGVPQCALGGNRKDH